jgi:glycosyltransferase involved in cell wall biosynthesis
LKSLIYLSPVLWDSYDQRSHHFAHWFHQEYDAPVIWYDPYPARLPRWQDMQRLKRRLNRKTASPSQRPEWLTVKKVPSLWLEPFTNLSRLNRTRWQSELRMIAAQMCDSDAIVCIGKPSEFALDIASRSPKHQVLYDVMDDFVSFFSGQAARSIQQRHEKLLNAVGHIWCSATTLMNQIQPIRADVILVPNGFADESLQQPAGAGVVAQVKRPRTWCYLGAVGHWFDWEMMLRLARRYSRDRVLIIGPTFDQIPQELPPNIELVGQMPRKQAMALMSTCDIGLIPFLPCDVTDAVDPIKYYEYRSAGLPVLSSRFGDMNQHESDEALVFYGSDDSMEQSFERITSMPKRLPAHQAWSAYAWKARFSLGFQEIDRQNLRVPSNSSALEKTIAELAP